MARHEAEFCCYLQAQGKSAPPEPAGVIVLTINGGQIRAVTGFLDCGTFRYFHD